jgi:hypothetical protein
MQSSQLQRREFITLLASAATAWPVASLAQEVGRARLPRADHARAASIKSPRCDLLLGES